MKHINLFDEKLEPIGTFAEWRWKFRKLAWLYLSIACILSFVCIKSTTKYIEVSKDTENIVEYISQASGDSYLGGLEYLAGKYHISPTKSWSDSTVYDIIEECGAWYPDIVMAQYIIESGSGSSNLARQANNLFGMRVAQRRPTTQLSGVDRNSYGVYLNWEHSIIDRVIWEQWLWKGQQPGREEYINKISSIYAEAPDYKTKIEGTSDKIRKLKNI